MPDPQLFMAFVLAVTTLMLLPGPNVALIVANSVAWGIRYGLLTVAGTSAAMVAQLALTALGMTGLLGVLGEWLEWLRWAGVAWLVYLGVAQWRAPVVDLAATSAEPKSRRAIFMRAFMVSLVNPKTLLFYGAFFPQFVTTARDVGDQIALLGVTFLALAVLLDSCWALAAARVRGLLATRGRLRNRLCGSLLVGAGVGLALARKN